ncbi:MAG: hypothetical protein ACK521_09265 [bacterium]|jgi:hypothetical protein
MEGMPLTTNFRQVGSEQFVKSTNSSANRQNLTQKPQDRQENEVNFLVNE